MEFSRKKLYLALTILGAGMALALVWHGWQRWGLGRGYPYDTFLYLPKERFGDFIDPVNSSFRLCPYGEGVYFPFAYRVCRYFGQLGMGPAIAAFLGLCSLGIASALLVALRPITRSAVELILFASALLALSYPFLICLDRGNTELLAIPFIGAALLFFHKRKWTLGLFFLLPAVCVKLYPILLMALFVRRGHVGKIVAMAAAFVAVNYVSLCAYNCSLSETITTWRENVRHFNEIYIFTPWGLNGSASAWNTLKAVTGTVYYVRDPSTISDDGLIPSAAAHTLFQVYSIAALLIGALVGLYIILVERELFRRAILLLLLITLAVPGGGDYRLLYIDIALVIMILLRGQQKNDLLVTALLAFVLIPKKEILLPYLGATDTLHRDVQIATLLNPPCLLLAIALMMQAGLKPGWWKTGWMKAWKIIRAPI